MELDVHDRRPGQDIQHYLAVLWRRKWVIVQALVILPALAYYLSSTQPAVYQASSDVLLTRQNIVSDLTDIEDPSLWSPDRTILTQANVAKTADLARRALARANVTDRGPYDLLGATNVSASETTDILTFHVSDGDPEMATRLATAYATEYIDYRGELDTLSVRRALENVERRIRALRAEGAERSAQYRTLLEFQQKLLGAEALASSTAVLLRPAAGAPKVAPTPMRSAMLALALAIVLGLGLAFLWEALDTRVRRSEQIAALLGLPLLARLAEPPRRLAKGNRLVMLEEPEGAQADAIRALRTNLEFVNIDRKARTVLVGSAFEGEGKSTTLANLAVALARSGHRVVLVDLDLRRPSQHLFFDLPSTPGLTDVVLGRAQLDDAVARVGLAAPATLQPRRSPNGRRANGQVALEGTLDVLTAGMLPPNPGEFVTAAAVEDLLDGLAKRADFVLVDGPPLLVAGDGLALSAKVDAVVLVARLGLARRPTMHNLRRALEPSPAAKLGVVVTGADAEVREFGSYYYEYSRARQTSARERSEYVSRIEG